MDGGLFQEKLLPDGKEIFLPLHLAPDHLGDQVQFLDSLDLHPGTAPDRDIHVLPYRTDPAFHLPGRTQYHADMLCDLLHLIGGMHAGRGGDLDERDAQPVKGKNIVLHPLCRLLFEADCLDLPTVRECPVQGNEGGTLEPAGIRPVNDKLAHGMDLPHRGHAEHLCDGKADGKRLVIHGCRRLLVVLDKACGIIGIILEFPFALHLFLCGPVNLPHLALCYPEIAEEFPGMFRTVAEERQAMAEEFFPGIQLLVDLDARGKTN